MRGVCAGPAGGSGYAGAAPFVAVEDQAAGGRAGHVVFAGSQGIKTVFDNEPRDLFEGNHQGWLKEGFYRDQNQVGGG